MSQDPFGSAGRGQGHPDPRWVEQPQTVLRPDDLSWRHPSQQADPPPTPPNADATAEPPAQWPPQWGSREPQQPQPPLPPQPAPAYPVPPQQPQAYPPQPYPEQAYAQQPGYPPQQVPQPSAPEPAGPPPGSVAWLQQRYPAPGEPAQPPHPPQPVATESAFAPPQPGSLRPQPLRQPPARRPPTRALVLAGVATVLVIAVVVAALVFGKAPGGQANPPRATGADAAVRFLEAVAAGDSARALSLQQQAPRDRTLLTDTVLRESRQRAPISRIRITHDSANDVEITYQLGEAEVRAHFVPVRQPDGSYKVDRGTTTVQVTRPKQVPVIVNGVRLTTNEVDAFPGAYETTTGLANISFLEPRFTISGPTSFPRLAPAAQLTEQGRRAMLDATRKALEECMKAKDLNPPNCPQQVRVEPNQRPDNASIRWELVEDPLAGQTPKLTIADDTVAELRLVVKTKISVTVMTDNRPGVVNAQPKEFSTQALAPMTQPTVSARFVN
ncbi:hypothetical protein HJ590_00165 [Naumannella sp. ID2617S]|nr:hypothetical protein [Naumannella sp. ID2617S]